MPPAGLTEREEVHAPYECRTPCVARDLGRTRGYLKHVNWCRTLFVVQVHGLRLLSIVNLDPMKDQTLRDRPNELLCWALALAHLLQRGIGGGLASRQGVFGDSRVFSAQSTIYGGIQINHPGSTVLFTQVLFHKPILPWTVT